MGCLDGTKVVELAGIGPGPMAGMMLADMGAEVIVVENPNRKTARDISFRGKFSIEIDLKSPSGINTLKDIIKVSDVLIDPFRPGVCERLGIGPDTCHAIRPELIFARITGWGQTGSLAHAAGHDINYISITGILHAIGPADEKPAIPLNLVGDMGGGGMLLVNGILGALLERSISGTGQTIDSAMVDGAAQQMWMIHSMAAEDQWDGTKRQANLLDGGSPYYNVYRCADNKYISIAAVEKKFYNELLERLGISASEVLNSQDKSSWSRNTARLEKIFAEYDRDRWCDLLQGTDVCFAPVLDLNEAINFAANRERQVYIKIENITQPAPAPRFDKTPSSIRHGAKIQGQDTQNILSKLGYSQRRIDELKKKNIIG